MSDTKTKKWNEEVVTQLMEATNGMAVVNSDTVKALAEKFGFTTRSVASKLRQLNKDVESMAKVRESTFSKEEGDALAKLVNDNPGVYTYKELSEVFPGEFSPKEIQGKLLALELTSKVKPTEKVEVARTYTPAEEEVFIKMAQAGSFIEEIAAALNREVQSVRGKALSLTRSGQITEIPKQKESHAKNVVDPVDALGDKVTTMTVEDIAAATDKTPRGVRTLLTRRGIKVANYDGAAKKAKALAAKAAEATK